MVDLKQYGQTEFEGTITSVYVKTLRNYLKNKAKGLTEEQIAKWPDKYNTLDSDHIIIIAECNGSPIDGFYTIPKVQGYGKSNLKRFIDKNNLPLIDTDNSKELKKWLGAKVSVKMDNNGFLRLVQ